MISSKRRVVRLSKRSISSLVGVGGGVSIKIVVVISAVEPAIVVVGIRVVGLWRAAALVVVSVLSGTGVFLSSANAGGSILLWRFESPLFL